MGRAQETAKEDEVRFKTKAVDDEFRRAHPRVIALACYADWWAMRNLGKDLVVTDVGRDQAEYDRIYSAKIAEGIFYVGEDGVRHYSGPRPHLEDPLHGVPSHAVDLRQPGELTMPQAHRLRDHLNAYWPRRDGKDTAMLHNVGFGMHFHLQGEVS